MRRGTRGPRTPKAITPEIQAFCGEITSGSSPLFVDVKPVAKELDACIEIVEAQVNAQGGQVLTGWAIWEWPYTVLVAEFHAVWIDTKGMTIDISPKQDGETRILFLPEPTRPFPRDQFVRSHYKAIRIDPKIYEYIRLKNRRLDLMPPPNTTYEVTPEMQRVHLALRTVETELKKMADARLNTRWRRHKKS